MESNLKFQKLHLLNVRVSELPLIPMFSRFNFISTSRIFPQFRNSIKIKTSLPINKLHSLSSSSSSAPVSLSENSPNEDSFEVFYLVNTFGWPPELAISKAKHMKFDTPEKPDNVVAFLKKHGFTKTQISMRAFVKCPKSIASSSVDKIVGIMDFLVNRMGMEAATIACQPHILSFGLEKRIVPRYLVYQVMLEKGLLEDKQKPSIITILSYRENLFIHNVIKRFEDEAPELLNLYQEMLDKSK